LLELKEGEIRMMPHGLSRTRHWIDGEVMPKLTVSQSRLAACLPPSGFSNQGRIRTKRPAWLRTEDCTVKPDTQLNVIDL
jgi:hypothetical protein